ncbi:hypothetical protein BBJ29_009993 [Phytophthora kernoviae]|uniref:Uncharacterized protein n=1 Tax=Phytophthora kernoviae TaxID=325452 RepID=A0A3F2RB58_9STRA|nr:hypothetical protein BBP00_00010019 [Phytophthora kernoviae]RLN66562.1 hypothetical protein BBJ29_009993 [Phytophthora kernoviae]
MKMLRATGFSATGEFSLTAARAQTEVLSRLSEQRDVDCQNALATSRYITLVTKSTGICNDDTTTRTNNTYLALDARRRAFVLTEREDTSTSLAILPHASELQFILSKLLQLSGSTDIFLCTPTSGMFSRARQQFLRKASDTSGASVVKPFTLMGACMVQQSMLLLQELVFNSEALGEAFSNAVVVADALKMVPSLRHHVLRQRLHCYVETHFIACLVLDPRVHGTGLSASGLRRARGVAVRVATALVPDFDETSFIQSYNDYMKQQGDFGEPGVWNPANTANPMQFWDDYEGDPLHMQLAQVAKTVCAYVPHTYSTEAFWSMHISQRNEGSASATPDQREKLAKIRYDSSSGRGRSTKSILNKFKVLLAAGNELTVDEMLHTISTTQQDTTDDKATTRDLSIRAVFESFHDGLEQDSAAMSSPPTTLDASWFDISSAGLGGIKKAMDTFLDIARKQ